jgi:hypothetical protein
MQSISDTQQERRKYLSGEFILSRGKRETRIASVVMDIPNMFLNQPWNMFSYSFDASINGCVFCIFYTPLTTRLSHKVTNDKTKPKASNLSKVNS